MKVSGFWVLLSVLGTALMLLSLSNYKASSSIPDVFSGQSDIGTIMTAVSRKLKENGYNPSTTKKSQVGQVNLDDYHRIDPVPSSKASMQPGPIEHGSPLIPYIPKPSPPGNPNGA
ncbi:hypothetical protein WN944_007779 [Citrus x changshan-huyou]|uniref:Uncharacterized protein n=1 Tax=Citrus x changshan-huyou TaxID=2935761 RepID=A0AAP0QQQ8_9ROSI